MAGALLGKLTLGAPIVTVAVSVYPLRPWHLNVHQLTLVPAGVPAKQTKLETARPRAQYIGRRPPAADDIASD